MADGDDPIELEATGERLIPEAYAGELVLAEHLARYLLAARLTAGRRVLAAACGEGYGTALLAGAGPERIVGLDVDERTVRHARQRYGLDIRQGDVLELPFADGEFDLVVSFETIEHVAEPERALSEFARVVGPDGLLIVSTPNAGEYLEDNPFHVRELAPDQFIRALRERFAEVRPLYQQNFLASAILDADALGADDASRPLPLDTRKVLGVPPGRELYTLALCGPQPLPELPADIAVLAGVYEAHQLADRLREETEISRRWHAAHDQGVKTQQEWSARATLAEETLEDALRTQRAWAERAAEAERQNAELRATLERIAASASWRVTKPLRRLRGRSQ
ncbi:MAG: class I SAM-dependent methyltransferase [Solirubrobacteraceae bacterium]